MGVDLATAQANYIAAHAAYQDALAARSVTSGDRTITRQDIEQLRNERLFWARMVAQYAYGRSGYSVARWTK